MNGIGLDKTHWIPHTHKHEQQHLLKRRQGTKIYRRKPADCHGANAVEQRIGVGYLVAPIARIEDPGEDKRGERAVAFNERDVQKTGDIC
jgi:hypothetical protein